jgi:hypothetical protein
MKLSSSGYIWFRRLLDEVLGLEACDSHGVHRVEDTCNAMTTEIVHKYTRTHPVTGTHRVRLSTEDGCHLRKKARPGAPIGQMQHTTTIDARGH